MELFAILVTSSSVQKGTAHFDLRLDDGCRVVSSNLVSGVAGDLVAANLFLGADLSCEESVGSDSLFIFDGGTRSSEVLFNGRC